MQVGPAYISNCSRAIGSGGNVALPQIVGWVCFISFSAGTAAGRHPRRTPKRCYAMQNPSLAWARRHSDYRYLVRSDLIGWLWPSEHKRLVAKLQRKHPAHYEKLSDFILPFIPATASEQLIHPNCPHEDRNILDLSRFIIAA